MKLTEAILQIDSLKRKLRNISIGVILGILLFSVIGFIIVDSYITKTNNELKSKQNRIELLESDVNIYIDKNKDLQNQIIVQTGTIKNLKDNIDLLDTDNKTLRKQVSNLNNLLFIAKTTIEASGSGVVKTDTSYIFRDRFINITGHLNMDSLYIAYKTNPIVITHVAYTKHKLFKPSYSVVDINVVPEMKVISGNTFIVKHDKKIYEKRWPYAMLGFVGGFLLAR